MDPKHLVKTLNLDRFVPALVGVTNEAINAPPTTQIFYSSAAADGSYQVLEVEVGDDADLLRVSLSTANAGRPGSKVGSTSALLVSIECQLDPGEGWVSRCRIGEDDAVESDVALAFLEECDPILERAAS